MERKGISPVILITIAALIWFIYQSWQKNHPRSPREIVGTESILYKDSTFILTTKIDTVYRDPERAHQAAAEEEIDKRSWQDR